MLTLNDGRSELWQWDTGRTLAVDNECSQVHFGRNVYGRSVDVDVVDGVAYIPDVLLQTDKELTAWAFVGTPENGYTKISKTFNVNRRNKPADYVFTATDQTTLGEILDRIEDLENRPSGDISKEDIQNAVNDYLEKNPVSVDETDPTVPAWAKEKEKPKYTAKEVGALPNTTAIPVVPSALPNPHKLTINGAVQAEYDGSKEVTLTIPESSSVTGDYIPTPTTAEIGQTIVVKSVDENGKPTEWEPKTDYPAFADPDSWELINTVTVAAEDEVWRLVINADSDGNKFAYDELLLFTANLYATSTSPGRIFINRPTPHQAKYANFNGFFTTNAQGNRKAHLRFLKRNVYKLHTSWMSAGEFLASSHDAIVISDYYAPLGDPNHGTEGYNTEKFAKSMFSFGIQTSGETVFMSGTFTLYGRNYK